MKKIKTPLDAKTLEKLKPGEEVLLSGVVFAFRDKAHKALLEEKFIPFDLKGQIIYYMGPSPTRPGRICGSCGPTTSERMDKYTPKLIKKTGIIGIIGKGVLGTRAYESMLNKTVYFITYAGLGALLAKSVLKSEVIFYPQFGAEAVFKMEVKDMPLIVAQDLKGKSIYGGDK